MIELILKKRFNGILSSIILWIKNIADFKNKHKIKRNDILLWEILEILNLNPTEREDPINKEINNICISSYEINRVLRKLDYIVWEKEKHRNYKLISDFNRERYNLENEQLKIRSQIENISHINSNEKFINQIKEEKNKQQELFNKYYKLNSETTTKINKLKDIKPILDEKINKAKEKGREKRRSRLNAKKENAQENQQTLQTQHWRHSENEASGDTCSKLVVAGLRVEQL